MLSATFKKTASTSLKLIVEPWANQYAIHAGDVVVVTLKGPAPAELEVDEKDGVVVVYAWVGCKCTVSINGIPHVADDIADD